jgi:hypothetical protein
MKKTLAGATARRLPYERPQLQVIELKAEETLAQPCKIRLTSPGPVTGCGRSNCAGRLGS